MQIREWIASQSILNPAVSVGNKSNQPTDAFSQLFESKKIPKIERNPMKEPVFKEPVQGNPEKIKVPIEDPVYKTDQVKVKQQENNSKDGPSKIDSKKTETKVAEKTNASEMTKEMDANEELDALKEKLKSKFGLSDEDLNALMAFMNLDLREMVQLLESVPEVSLDLIKEIHVSLESLEINKMLNEPLDLELVEKLDQQIELLKQSLEPAIENSNPEHSALLANVMENFDEILVKFQQTLDIKPSDASTKKEQTEDAPLMTTKNSEGTVQSDTPVKSSQVIQKDAETKPVDQQKSETNLELKTSGAKDVSEHVHDPDTNSAQNQDVDDVISFHQLVMRQPGLVSNQTVQGTQVLKQDIFTQVMDAVKGNFKIDENGTSMLVKLQPEQLGNVELKLNIHKGLVMAEIKVENEIVKAAVESGLDDLKQNLANKGFTVNQINVSVDTGKKEQQEAFEFLSQKKASKKGVQSVEEENGNETRVQTYMFDSDETSTINYLG